MKFLYFLGVFASPVLSQLTDLNPFGRCNRKCENELEKYFKSNNAATHCALLFDEDCCDPDGWALPIPQGYVELESANLDRLLVSIVDKPKKRDAESLVVRAGCSLVARTEPWGKEGYSFNFQAPKNEHLVIGELSEDHEELEEQIEAVHCYCGNGALKTPKITEKTSALRIVGDNFRKCNDFVSLFDRPSTKDHKRTCAIVFDEKNCDYDDGVDDAFEEVTEGRTVLDDGNQAESIMVRPGCVFTGYDDDDYAGKKMTIDNKGNTTPKVKNLSKALIGSGSDLFEDIESVECKC